jgi:uncharacterized protein (TIGR02145 family)
VDAQIINKATDSLTNNHLNTNIMKNKHLLSAFCLLVFCFAGYSQNTIQLTFSAGNNGQILPLDSILIKNLTQNDEVMLYSPENSIVLVITSIGDNQLSINPRFEISDVWPNPVVTNTFFTVRIPEKDEVEVSMTDISGRQTGFLNKVLTSGVHSFRVKPGNARLYMLTVRYQGNVQTTKMISQPEKSNQNCFIGYEGAVGNLVPSKSGSLYPDLVFQPGDELLMVGYSGGGESGLADSPEESRDYYFEFANKIACPGLDSLLYEGQWYQTIQVWGQCWMKENLNVGVKIQGSQIQSDNGIVEKYCYGNSDNFCNTYGALYLWEEIMQYSTEPRSRGICPEGWHIPTDAELGILEGAADSYYSIAHPVWQNMGTRGYDNGKHLKSTSGWMQNGNGLDTYFFTVISTGYWFEGGFSDLGENAIYFSSSTSGTLPIFHGFSFGSNQSMRNANTYQIGLPVRCIKNL